MKTNSMLQRMKLNKIVTLSRKTCNEFKKMGEGSNRGVLVTSDSCWEYLGRIRVREIYNYVENIYKKASLFCFVLKNLAFFWEFGHCTLTIDTQISFYMRKVWLIIQQSIKMHLVHAGQWILSWKNFAVWLWYICPALTKHTSEHLAWLQLPI